MFSAVIIGILVIVFLYASIATLIRAWKERRDEIYYKEWRKRHNLPGDPENSML